MRRVITYGTFDLLHHGHINILKRAKELGDYLIVAVSTDEFNLQKNKQSFHRYQDRAIVVEAVRYVDQVIPENDWAQKITDIVDLKVATFVMGDDWEGKFDYLKEYCDVVYLPRTVGISSSYIKSKLSGGRGAS
jgi:glycerol-3-phosphate cytidylyltransferase